MTFEWLEYIKLAEQLAQNADEASQRTAISRAYYYVYHAANNRALANNYKRPEDGGGSHNNLWSHYERNTDPDCRRVAFLGKRLHEKRVRADYRDTYVRISDEMGTVLLDAKRCASMIEALPPQYPQDPPPRIFSV